MKTKHPHSSAVATFHRFSRRSYAAFASMHREVRIGILAVSTLASVALPKVQAATLLSGSLLAQEDRIADPDDHDLDEVAVSGTLSPLTTLQSARLVNVITAQQIQSAAAHTVNDILKLAVGVDVRQRGGFGIQTDISIDGGTFDQITILLNGVNITSPHTGHLAADFPVGLSDIERIEILEGAASRVYGASAFGGAINIVTKKVSPASSPSGTSASSSSGTSASSPSGTSASSPSGTSASSPSLRSVAGGLSAGDKTTLDAGLHAGSYGTCGADARLSLPRTASGGFPAGVSLSAAYQRSDGATVNSAFSRGNAYLRSVYDAPDFRLDLQAGYSQKSYGANTFYSAAYPDQYERNTRIITSLAAESKGRVRLRPEVYWHRLYDNFELIHNTTTGENFHRSDVHGARLTASYAWLAGRTALGAEVREEGIYSTSLGLPLYRSSLPAIHQPGVHLPSTSAGAAVHLPSSSAGAAVHLPSSSAGDAAGGFPAGSSYTRHDSRTNLSFNVEHTLILPRFTLSAGLLANMNTRFDSHLNLYPGVDLSYRPSSHWRLFVSYNKGFRLPTFTDLYYKSPTHEGNSGMHAEESHSIQLGLQGNSHFSLFTFNYSLKTFYHRGTNMIDWVMYTPDDIFHSANFDLDNMGVSAAINSHFSIFNLKISYAFLHQHRRDDNPIYKSNYAMEYLRHKLVATLDHPIAAHLSASWSLRWQDRMGSYILYENAQSTGRLVPYDPYATLDLKLRWTAPHYELWAEATNLTNRRYYDLGNIPQPGIFILAGARICL